MIEDMMICKFVAELAEFNSDLSVPRMIVGTFALVASNPGSRCKHSYKCGNGLDEQLETVSAQIARGFSGRQGSVCLMKYQTRAHV